MKEDAFILMNYLVVKKEYDYSMGAHKKYTAEEKEKKKKEYWALYQRPRTKADEERIKGYQLGGNAKVTKKKAEAFKKEVREHNQKRFDEIINDAERWKIINTSSEKWLQKKERQERVKKNGGGKWVTKEEIERAEKVIWGGIGGEIFKEDVETPYHNPYEENI